MASTTRVFLDANVLVAIGFRPSGAYSRLLSVQGVRFVTSEHILREVEDNLRELGVDAVALLEHLRAHFEITNRVSALPLGLPLEDDEDRQALAEAIGAACGEFVTFDRGHFGALFGRSVLGVRIRHSAEFLRERAPPTT